MNELNERTAGGMESGSIRGRNLSEADCRPEPSDRGDCCEAAETEIPTSPKRQINIEPADLGFIVRVGCQTFAVETKESLLEKLTKYLNDPNGVEKEWMKNRKF